MDQLIRVTGLPETYADSLNPYVAGMFRELWRAAQVNDEV